MGVFQILSAGNNGQGKPAIVAAVGATDGDSGRTVDGSGAATVGSVDPAAGAADEAGRHANAASNSSAGQRNILRVIIPVIWTAIWVRIRNLRNW